jgi:single-strand DNA-binding protein
MDAQLSMTGWVGSEVEFRHTQATGTSRATFRLACTPRVRRQGTWTDDPTTWLTITCWRSLAEHVGSSLGKGEPVLVIGRLRTQTWDDDQGGKHERLVLDATSVGHDLSKGTAAFRRAQRQQPRPEDQPETAAPDQQEVTANAPDPSTVTPATV